MAEDKQQETNTEINNQKEYTWEEVSKHNDGKNCWVVIKNIVYNVTSYLDEHPGGPVVISNRAGKDVTKPFEDAGHSQNAFNIMKKYIIGTIQKDSVPLPGQVETSQGMSFSQIGLLFGGLLIAFLIYLYLGRNA